jgi:hypothetical protein
MNFSRKSSIQELLFPRVTPFVTHRGAFAGGLRSEAFNAWTPLFICRYSQLQIDLTRCT